MRWVTLVMPSPPNSQVCLYQVNPALGEKAPAGRFLASHPREAAPQQAADPHAASRTHGAALMASDLGKQEMRVQV